MLEEEFTYNIFTVTVGLLAIFFAKGCIVSFYLSKLVLV